MRINIKYVFVLFPFILVFIAEIISFRDQQIGSVLKLCSVFYMLMYSLLQLKYNLKLLTIFAFFLPFFFYHIIISFNFIAALEEAIRYLFPIVVLFYSYSIRTYYKLLIYFVIAYALLNNFYQLINYFNWVRGVNYQWFYFETIGGGRYYYNSTMGIIRGVGLMGFFATYGFLNLIAFFLTRQYYTEKYKKGILIILSLGILSSLSFKSLGVFILLLFLLSKYKTKLMLWSIGLFTIIIVSFPKEALTFGKELGLRIELYITKGNSARAESYRVMFNDIADYRFFGRGVGSFGGDSSTKYNSPVYDEVNFNWHLTTYLTTTDTYFPHVFVELGIISGLLYLIVILTPVIKRHFKKETFLVLFVIYFALFFDSLFSFALNNLGYLMLSLTLIYPLFEYEKEFINSEDLN